MVWKQGMTQWTQAGQVFPPPPPDPNEPPPMPDVPQHTQLPKDSAGMMDPKNRLLLGYRIALVVAAIAAILPWAQLLGSSESGLKTPWGLLTLLVALGGVVFTFVNPVAILKDKVRIGMAAVGGVIALLAVIGMAAVPTLCSPGPGVYLALVAGLAAGGLGFVNKWDQQIERVRRATNGRHLCDAQEIDPQPEHLSGGDLMADNPEGFASKAKSIAASVASRGKAAAQLIAKQAERTKLTTINLPSAYQALGKHIYSSGAHRAVFPGQHQQIDGLANEIKAIQGRSATHPKAEGIAAKAKVAATATKDVAQAKALQMKLNHALGELGMAVFDKQGSQSGPDELTRPLAESLSRLRTLDGELQQLSHAQAGQIVTPKRIVVGGAVLVVLIVAWLAHSMMFKKPAIHNGIDAAVEQRDQAPAQGEEGRGNSTASGLTCADLAKRVIGYCRMKSAGIAKETRKPGYDTNYLIRGNRYHRSEMFEMIGKPDEIQEDASRSGAGWIGQDWIYRCTDGEACLEVSLGANNSEVITICNCGLHTRAQ